MTENNPLKKISLLNPIHLLAVGFGSGLIHPAPGTWGSLAGTILGVILLSLLSIKTFLIFTALCLSIQANCIANYLNLSAYLLY